MTEIAVPVQPSGGRSLAGVFLRQALPLSLGIILIYMLTQRVGSLDTDHLLQAFGTVSPAQWALALVATAISFSAVGRYDVVMHRILQTSVSDQAASYSGKTAIALSQTLGLGVLTGAVARWRMIPSLTFIGALSLSVTVALSFLAGWAIFTSAVLLVLPPAAIPGWGPAAVLLGASGAAIYSFCRPVIAFRGREIALPPLAALSRLPWLAAVDTLAAAAALWFLLPSEVALPFSVFLPAFLLAFGAGLISGTPGGLGAFELTLLALLPEVPQPPLLAAVMAFRLVYFALPALLALAALLVGAKASQPSPSLTRDPFADDIHDAPFAEANLLSAGDLTVLNGPHSAALAMVARRGQSLIALGPALTRSAEAHILAQIRQAATKRYLRPCIYKGDGRLACAARRAGWSVMRLSAEAVLDPATFNPECPSRRQLRRKLRKASAAGVEVRHAGDHAPLSAMSEIAAQWAKEHGGERGFSMGRFDPEFIKTQRTYLAYLGGQIIAFATFNKNPNQWSLDLMRSSSDVPTGTMHALIASALHDAAILGCADLSLSAATPPPATGSSRLAMLEWRLFRTQASQGLFQFKASFGPSWRPRYLAAPSRLALILSGLDVAVAIFRPRPIRPDRQTRANS